MGKIRSSCLVLAAASLVAGGAQAVSAASEQTAPPSLIVSHAAAPARSSREVAALPATPGCTVDPNRELFIIDTSVVQDCFRTTWTGACPTPVAPATRGAWTLGGLLPGVFGTNDPVKLSNLTKQWLGEWKVNKTINGDTVPARAGIQFSVIDPWQAASGGTTLDMTKAPFRLLAIVFRLDLRRGSGYSGGGSAGEARFVFTLRDFSGQDQDFGLILEYGLDATTCAAIQTWAQRVHNLGTIPFGPNYNAALQGVTDLYTLIGTSPGKPNGSSINQVRTNEIFISPPPHAPWELREFKLQPPQSPVPVPPPVAVAGSYKALAPPPPPPAPAPLLLSTVAQTPANRHKFQQIFADYVNANTTAILADNYTVPLTFQSQGFRGGAVTNSTDYWDGPGVTCSTIANAQARHIASLNTCNGCHAGETGIDFLHVAPTPGGGAATLSSFLTGSGPLVDVCGLVHSFGDIQRRRVDLCQLLQKSCTQVDAEQPVSFVH